MKVKRLLVYLKGYRKECVLGPLFKLLEASFELFVPLVMANIIDIGISNADSAYVIRMSLVLVALGVVGLVCSITAQYFAAGASVGFSAKLRSALFSHIQTLSHTEMDGIGASTLITRMTSDINQIQNGLNLTLRLLLRSPFVVFGAMIMAFTVDVPAALIFLCVILLLAAVVFGIMLKTMPGYKKVQAKLERVLSAVRENLTGVRVVRAFGREEEEIKGFRKVNEELTALQLFVGKISSLMNPLTFVLINLAAALLLWVGAVRVDTGMITQGAVVALINYMAQILVELIKLANLIINISKALACANRVADILDTESTLVSPESSLPPTEKGSVVFDDVSFTYKGAGAPSLSHISFKALPGETVGIIGGTGSGKSTLVNLIPRFYDVSEGRVSVGGVDVRSRDLSELRNSVGAVPQKPMLFSGTVAGNLRWGNEDASDDELWEALCAAQAEGFIKEKPGQLNAHVAQGGRNFSGGQRQRLTIARALVRKPEILIFDDSSSALDFATDARLRKAIRETSGSATVFIVSQRTSSIQYADRIIVLEEGKAVGIGTHEELLSDCLVYREIHEAQFKKTGEGAEEA